MPNYKEMYLSPAAKVAEAIDLLVEAQRQGEESAVEGESGRLMRMIDIRKHEEPTPEQ